MPAAGSNRVIAMALPIPTLTGIDGMLAIVSVACALLWAIGELIASSPFALRAKTRQIPKNLALGEAAIILKRDELDA